MIKRLMCLALIACALGLGTAVPAFAQRHGGSQCEKDDHSKSPPDREKKEPPKDAGAIKGDFFHDMYKDPPQKKEPDQRGGQDKPKH
jgi:hypothetical protein